MAEEIVKETLEVTEETVEEGGNATTTVVEIVESTETVVAADEEGSKNAEATETKNDEVSEIKETEETKEVGTEKPKKSNVISDASILPPSEDQQEILKQVEFYFSDQNLPNDKFLFKTSQANEGWVPISTIAAFARMRRFRPLSLIVDALKKSDQLLEVSEDNEKVRRRLPLVEPKREEKQDQFSRSIYAKGFGEEVPSSQFDIEKFFEKFGEVKQVRLRRTDDKSFKGSVFAEFAKLADAQAFLSLESKPTYNDTELLTMSKEAYVKMKADEHGFTNTATGGRRNKKFNAFRDQQDNKKKRSYNNDRNDRHNNKRRRDGNFRPNNRNREKEREKDTDTKSTETATAEASAE